MFKNVCSGGDLNFYLFSRICILSLHSLKSHVQASQQSTNLYPELCCQNNTFNSQSLSLSSDHNTPLASLPWPLKHPIALLPLSTPPHIPDMLQRSLSSGPPPSTTICSGKDLTSLSLWLLPMPCPTYPPHHICQAPSLSHLQTAHQGIPFGTLGLTHKWTESIALSCLPNLQL